MALYVGSPQEIFERKYRQPLVAAPGLAFLYSDVGFEVLGELVRRVSSLPLEEFARQRVFVPLGMNETEFSTLVVGLFTFEEIFFCLPLPRHRADREDQRRRPTRRSPRPARVRARRRRGPRGAFLDGGRPRPFCAAMLAGGGGVLSPATVAAMTRPRSYGDERSPRPRLGRGDAASRPSGATSSRSDRTGTRAGPARRCGWIRRRTRSSILLTNRNHPDESGNVIALRGKVATIVALGDHGHEAGRASNGFGEDRVACGGRGCERRLRRARARLRRPLLRMKEAAAAPARVVGQVRPGIDTLEEKSFDAIKGLKVALLTNHTGLTRDGRSTIDVLNSPKAKAAGVTLSKLFSPEHGIEGPSTRRSPTRSTRRRAFPSARSTATRRSRGGRGPRISRGLDAVVVDLQDAGCRFYTYLASMGYVLEEAAKAKVEGLRPRPAEPDPRGRLGGPARPTTTRSPSSRTTRRRSGRG